MTDRQLPRTIAPEPDSEPTSAAEAGLYEAQFGGAYRGRRVLVTGHNGFQGTWLTQWLRLLGARVVGLSLAPGPMPNHSGLLKLRVPEAECDLRDPAAVRQTVRALDPEVVFHLGGQSILRRALREPADTFQTNVMGLVHLFEALRRSPSVRSIVNVTSDKCYLENDGSRALRETDRLGGDDPYSASKACGELISMCYQRSFFADRLRQGGGDNPARGAAIATARSGNAIGGGDWSEERLVPDLVRAAVTNRVARLHAPRTTRPWQHVLDPISGYLLLGAQLIEGPKQAARPWNFGPDDDDLMGLSEFVALFQRQWPALRAEFEPGVMAESAPIRLDTRRVRERLGWRPVWRSPQAIAQTAEWYRAYHEHGRVVTRDQIKSFSVAAVRLGLAWTGATAKMVEAAHAEATAHANAQATAQATAYGATSLTTEVDRLSA
jgi:CDP-glucose 4,6-dehydratase